MPVPSNISDLSTTPANNSPAGTETPGTVDDYLRVHAAFIATLNAADAAHIAAADPHTAYALEADVSATLANYAPKASPALSGTPTAPTAAAGTNTTQLATTAFVQDAKPAEATQAEMEAGTESGVRSVSPLGVAQAIAAKSSGGIRGQVFTSSGTFTVPDGVTAVKVRGCSGGGGAAASGSNGGTTSFGSYCSATGGMGSPNGGTGGVAAGGDINLTGSTRTTSFGGLCGGSGLFGGVAGSATVEATGYGNGGGSSSGANGGGGGYFERYITGLTPGDTITVTIGAGGNATSGAKGAPGICVVEW